MTVYPEAYRKTNLHILNLALLFLAAALVLGYVTLSNRLVSQRYSAEQFRDELYQANVALELKNSAIEDLTTLETLTEFARRIGLVEAKETGSIFEDAGVALTARRN